MKGKISIIVPVYNTEKYLNKCIESILKQSYHDFELILIDDGSTDNSYEICMSYQKIDNRIIVLQQKNAGTSSARNYGIDRSSGEYIIFIDADDYIHPYMLRGLLNPLIEYSADIAIAAYKKLYREQEEFDKESSQIKLITSEEAIIKLHGETGEMYTVAWGKIYKRSIIGDLRYPSGKKSEDEYITYKLLWNANKILVNDSIYYYYNCFNSFSETQLLKTEVQNDVYNAFEERQRFFIKEGNLLLASLAHRSYLDRVMKNFNDILLACDNTNKKEYMKELVEKYRIKYKDGFFKVKGRGYIIFYFSPKLYFILRKIKGELCKLVYRKDQMQHTGL